MPYDKHRVVTAHLSILAANVFWGLMAPVGKYAMSEYIDGITMVTFRVLGGCMLFWLASLIAPKEHVPLRDRLLFAGAAFFGLICNQCCYTIGLSYTSPINASIVTTTLPVFAMILSFIILREPISGKKVGGVILGCLGAITLILTSITATNDKVGDLRGDLLCLAAQFSFAFYLSRFNNLIRRYSTFTINKWMFLWASVILLPFTSGHVAQLQWHDVTTGQWLGVCYVVLFGTFVCYVLTMLAQQTLRPTVISSYNYVQPTVSMIVSVIAGVGIFQYSQVLAVIFVFVGVYLVSKSRSRNDIQSKAEN